MRGVNVPKLKRIRPRCKAAEPSSRSSCSRLGDVAIAVNPTDPRLKHLIEDATADLNRLIGRSAGPDA